MGLLDGGLKATFAAAFSGIFLDGTLHTGTVTQLPGGASSISYADTAIKGMRDVVTESMRSEPGYTADDVALIILQQGIPEITSNDQVTLAGNRWSVASVSADPAGGAWVCRGQAA